MVCIFKKSTGKVIVSLFLAAIVMAFVFTDTKVNAAQIVPTVVGTAPADSTFVFKKDLKVGAIDLDVQQLQKFLNTHEFTVASIGPGSLKNETTKFGFATKAALIRFQLANNISPAVGYFGPLTRGVVNKIMKTVISTTECQTGDLFSSITGLPCNTGYAISNFFPAGCTSNLGFSSTTGLRCLKSGSIEGKKMVYATAPSGVELAVSSTNPVGGVTNVAIPDPGQTDTTGAVNGWRADTADQINFIVTDAGNATSIITIDGTPYTSGDDYIIASTDPFTIVVTTTETGKTTAVRTFVVSVTSAPPFTTNMNLALTTPVENGTTNHLTGGGATKTVEVDVANGTTSVVITGTKLSTQTVAIAGVDVGTRDDSKNVTVTGTATNPIYTVNTVTNGLAFPDGPGDDVSMGGGNKTFTFTVSEPGKSDIVYHINVLVAWPSQIDQSEIDGVGIPVMGDSPTLTIDDTSEYTATISWDPVDDPFVIDTVYTATITITPKAGYTLTGVPADFFWVDGADTHNSTNSGIVTAVFPKTAHVIGESYEGGKIVYLLRSSDPGYDADVQHGLVAPTIDQSNSKVWSTVQNTYVSTGTVLGTGQANTQAIIDQGNSVQVQDIDFDATPDNGGTWTLNYDGHITDPIPAFDNAYDQAGIIKDALVATDSDLTNINIGYLGDGFAIELAGVSSPVLLTVDSNTLTSGGNPVTINISVISPDSGALLCHNLSLGGYSDWYLPSLNELTKLLQSGNFAGFPPYTLYESSTSSSASSAWSVESSSLYQYSYSKGTYPVRCIRSF